MGNGRAHLSIQRATEAQRHWARTRRPPQSGGAAARRASETQDAEHWTLCFRGSSRRCSIGRPCRPMRRVDVGACAPISVTLCPGG